MSEVLSEIQANIASIQSRITAAAERSGRSVEDVRLMAVTKKKSAGTIQALFDGGIRSFGENYPDETKTKEQVFSAMQSEIELSMIGHLQSRKIPVLVSLFDSYHAVNRKEIAIKLDRMLESSGKHMPVMIEINIGNEPSKHGWIVNTAEAKDQFFRDLTEIMQLPNLEVCGLMSLPPYSEDPEQVRPYFRQMKLLRDELKTALGVTLPHLSMGTSSDFEAAIEEGSTWVRIGTALTGPRV